MKTNLLRFAPVALALGMAAPSFAAAPVPSNTGYSSYSASDCQGLYTQKYDSTFGLTLKGLYAINSDSDMPGLGGGLLSLNSYIETENLVHDLSLSIGIATSAPKRVDAYHIGRDLGYTSKYVAQYLNDRGLCGIDRKYKINTAVPLLAGYNLNIPLSANSVYFFLGAKAGVTFSNTEITYSSWKLGTNDHPYISDRSGKTYNETKFTYTFTAGFRFSIGDTTDLLLAYELIKVKDTDPYHAIEAGVSWTF